MLEIDIRYLGRLVGYQDIQDHSNCIQTPRRAIIVMKENVVRRLRFVES